MKKVQSGWSERQRQQWAVIRAQGRRHYIWRHGVLTWGGFMLCFSLGVYHYRQYGSVISTEGSLWLRLVVGALVWTYVGYLYGRASWHDKERQYLAQSTRGDSAAEI